MRTRCLTCRTKYQIPDDRVIGKVLRIRCRKCQNVMKVVGPTDAFDPRLDQHPPTLTGVRPYRPDAAQSKVTTSPHLAEGPVWWCGIGGQRHGPFSAGEIYKLVQRNEIHARTYMWRKGMENWQRIGESPRLAFAYNWLIQRAGEDFALLGPREASSVFDQVALVSDGNTYFPDPTLQTGWLVLDDRTQAYLETCAEKAEKRQMTRRAKSPNTTPASNSKKVALSSIRSPDKLPAVTALAVFSMGIGVALGGAVWLTHASMIGV
jgi:hypothetical protein